eukprot:CAMPEP_0182517102 /NCGR_PEP_ID=MMETSP1321-20130603/41606_1 /TAXON_ID=91990 /ORGANISM="Bolidomonas sp., Strain RCC1657" /LENGTH=41 /DNA_ID= /DNA_START= /DNA_END= /DNA_ORIENTATION=
MKPYFCVVVMLSLAAAYVKILIASAGMSSSLITRAKNFIKT